MIGVILWSDPAAKKAVIWCEDHGDLAFLSRPETAGLPDVFVDVGDVVEFDLLAQRNTRRAENVKLISEARGAPAVSQLRATHQAVPAHMHQSAEILPFRLDAPVRRNAGVDTPERLQG